MKPGCALPTANGRMLSMKVPCTWSSPLPSRGRGSRKRARTASGIGCHTGRARMPWRWSSISSSMLCPCALSALQSTGSRLAGTGCQLPLVVGVDMANGDPENAASHWEVLFATWFPGHRAGDHSAGPAGHLVEDGGFTALFLCDRKTTLPAPPYHNRTICGRSHARR